MRTFIAIDLSKEVKNEIKKIQNSLPKFEGKKTEIRNLHLTLKFLGEIDEETLEKVKNKLKEIKFNKFNAKISEMGTFKENFIKIIWVKLENCEKLQKEIDNNLKDLFKKEERFMPHITISRVKDIKDKKTFLEKLKKIKIKELEFEVNSFKLKESKLKQEGPEYRDIEAYGLQ